MTSAQVAVTPSQMTIRIQVARDLALAHAALSQVITAAIGRNAVGFTTAARELAVIARRLDAGDVAAWSDEMIDVHPDDGVEARLPALIAMWERTQADLVDCTFARILLEPPGADAEQEEHAQRNRS